MDALDASANDRQSGNTPANPPNVDEMGTGAGKTPAETSSTAPAKSSESDPKAADCPRPSEKQTFVKRSKNRARNRAKKTKKPAVDDESSDESASDGQDSTSHSSSSDDDEDDDTNPTGSLSDDDSRRKSKSKRKPKPKPKPKCEKGKKPSSSSSSKKPKKSKKSYSSESDSSASFATQPAFSDDEDYGMARVSMSPQEAQLFKQWQRGNGSLAFGNHAPIAVAPPFIPPRGGRVNMGLVGGRQLLDSNTRPGRRSLSQTKKGRTKLDYRRVDQIWDNNIHNYKLQDTAEITGDSQYDGYVLQIRRTFDWEGKYKLTIVDIKSKILRECLQDVIGNIKGVSLVDDVPKLDPNLLFLYLEDLRNYAKRLKRTEPTSADRKERKKQQKSIENMRQHLKVLLRYLDKDYAQVKKSLYPMLANGLITFDLLWALWKPNTLVYTNTYGTPTEPRVFKVEQAEKHASMIKGEFYWVDGKYFEFDGKQFGYGSFAQEIQEFRGARKITSLSAYPLEYHKDKESVKAALIERGKKFVRLSGVHYKSHEGLAYFKKKNNIIKVNVNGRVMIDPAVHRRINPNYQVSAVRPKDHDLPGHEESDDAEDDDEKHPDEQDSEENVCASSDGDCEKMVIKIVRDDKGKPRLVQVPESELEQAAPAQRPLESLERRGRKDDKTESSNDPQKIPVYTEETNETTEVSDEECFSDEEYLIASPVVLGFSFSEKLWLEFTVSGIKDIQWNETAYDSLVLEPKQKDIVKALVESHKYHAAESIDDVIQGKGKGLVAVLHGPPGTGKTLTAEGISELLQCPLYMASAGELGTDPRYLEQELQKILDICHAWGAILLLDEADVFLERRDLREINRNALVSIFLRKLEYFQGILFMTTNRVQTFDDAFQSRIHVALRYEELSIKAKKAVFKIFVERVRVLEKVDLMPLTEQDYTDLAKYDLNGRQIKNTIRTAKALAVNKREALSMDHIRQVLDVQKSFDAHLKGGTGYEDALRSYY